MKNLIRSEEEQLRKQEAEIAKKTHEKALLEQFFSQTPKDFTSNSLNECCTSLGRVVQRPIKQTQG